MNTQLPFLSTKTLAQLDALGIHTREQLKELGAVAVFLALKSRHQGITKKMLAALCAAEHGTPIHEKQLEEAITLAQTMRFAPLMPNEKQEAEFWMNEALKQAKLAEKKGEIPVGAVIVQDGICISAAHNLPIETHDPSAHAELIALRNAAAILKNYRLNHATLYVTLEPCPMCAGAIFHSRLKRVVFGASDPKGGAGGGAVNLFAHPQLNPHTALSGGILQKPCQEILQNFFKNRRKSIS